MAADLVIDPKDLTVGDKELGSGGFGVVFRGELRGRPVAVKIYKGNEELDRESQFMEVLREALPMIQLRHPNIVQLLGICRHDKHGLMIVIELCEGGSLASYLAKNGPLPPDVRDRFAKQICEGVQYLHDNHIVHRDLKPENILLDKGHNIKISDFGMIRSSDRKTTLTAVGGTPNFMPPEGFEVDLDKLTVKAAIWALGRILGQIHGGRPAFEGKGILQISRKVVDKKEIPDIPVSLPPHIKSAIKSCFAYKASDRPTAKQVLDKLGISTPGASQPGKAAAEPSLKGPLGWLFGGFTQQGAASPADVSPVGRSSGVHMSTASTTTGPPSRMSKTSQPPSQHIAPPAQQPSLRTPPSARQRQIKYTDIFDAVAAGDVSAVSALLKAKGPTILNEREGFSNWRKTPFMEAAEYGRVEVLEVMYEMGGKALLEQTGTTGYAAIHVAAQWGRVDAFNKLLEWSHDSQLTMQINDGATPLLCAAFEGHVDVVRVIFSKGGKAILNHQSKNGMTALHWAARKGFVEVASQLLGRIVASQHQEQ
ncbi:unnamed protein product [Vitrella brassicaformis CCMP3155]|uniref:Protein kinase domain-containing protein n=1 Tax=Vitrella brassicaformis (strain CCMP3155) TaxID=1169540 RepID=A0A0G4G5G4_VITBC|nr:unnamed protein product [Vitrella brassicaformis CCMP3155]|eukprot:CEM23290.1 unnamed protein product [Vitrella brassicaformis CCMP3155]